MFHSFILMNMFNQINCRVVDARELNVFKTLFNNPIFWVIFALEIGIQQLMVNPGSNVLLQGMLGTAPLTEGMTITAWSFGAFSLVVNVLLKQLPLELFAFAKVIDLETVNEKELINKYMAKGESFYKSKKEAILTAGE